MLLSSVWISFALCAATCVSLADSVTLHPVADTTLLEMTPGNNLGAHTDFISGTTAGNAGQPYRNRALLKFDIAGQIPTGAAITSATLTLLVVRIPSLGAASASAFDLHRLLVSWGEGNKTDRLGLQATTGEATWISRFTLLPQWGAPGGKEGTDFLTDASASAFVVGLGRYTFGSTSNLVADIQFWLDNANSNFGWILISQDEATAGTARRFASREAAANAPALVIEYTPGQPQPPRLSQMSLLGDTVTFRFDVVPQRSYAVEFNNTLGTTNWLTLTNIAAQPTPTNITVSDSATASQRFYRVKAP